MSCRRTISVALLAAVLVAMSDPLSAAPASVGGAASNQSGTPPMPALSSPVKFFRDLLARSPVEREQLLANRPPGARQVILAKLQEYESLPAGERELRLRTTELSWYLKQLMPLTGAQRLLVLTNLAAADRELVEARLAFWDRISPEQQQRLLQNEAALPYLAALRSGDAAPPVPADRRKLMEKLEQLHRLQPGERDKVVEQFKQLFELDANERAKVLDGLPEAQRARMQRALNLLREIPAEKQTAYVDAVRRFAAMSPEDRAQFLKSAERWKQLSDEERSAWRALATQMPPLPDLPPLPPGFNPSTPLTPPMPPSTPVNRFPLQATNVPPQPGGA